LQDKAERNTDSQGASAGTKKTQKTPGVLEFREIPFFTVSLLISPLKWSRVLRSSHDFDEYWIYKEADRQNRSPLFCPQVRTFYS
jgi:hypothetical protein